MTIRGFLWLDAIVEKLGKKHAVSIVEVEQVFENDDPAAHFRFVERGFTEGEDVYSAMGQTDGGRYLIVFFVLKKDGRALVVSARAMTDAERRLYGKR